MWGGGRKRTLNMTHRLALAGFHMYQLVLHAIKQGSWCTHISRLLFCDWGRRRKQIFLFPVIHDCKGQPWPTVGLALHCGVWRNHPGWTSSRYRDQAPAGSSLPRVLETHSSGELVSFSSRQFQLASSPFQPSAQVSQQLSWTNFLPLSSAQVSLFPSRVVSLGEPSAWGSSLLLQPAVQSFGIVASYVQYHTRFKHYCEVLLNTVTSSVKKYSSTWLRPF